MKKTIFLLLLSVSIYGQTTTGKEQKFLNGIRNMAPQTVTNPANLVTQGTDGTYGKMSGSLIEKTANKQNSLAVDGTGIKYPTVDAINEEFENVVHKTGDESLFDVKTFQNIVISGGKLKFGNALSPAINGEIYDNNSFGTIISAKKGGVDDLSIVNSNGDRVVRVPTGTQRWELGDNSSLGSTVLEAYGSGLFRESLKVTNNPTNELDVLRLKDFSIVRNFTELTSALALGRSVVIAENTEIQVTSIINVTADNVTIIGKGSSSVLKKSVGIDKVLNITGGNCKLLNFEIKGTDDAIIDIESTAVINTLDDADNSVGEGGNNAIYGVECDGLVVDNIGIKDFNGNGIKILSAGYISSIFTKGVTVNNVSIENCYRGMFMMPEAEYSRFSNINVLRCLIGATIKGGNNNLTNSHFTENRVGLILSGTGSGNNAHGMFSNVSSNHCSLKGLLVKGVTNGQTISGFTNFGQGVVVDGCKGITWVGGQIGFGGSIIVKNSIGKNSFKNINFFSASYGITLDSNAIEPFLEGNFYSNTTDNDSVLNTTPATSAITVEVTNNIVSTGVGAGVNMDTVLNSNFIGFDSGVDANEITASNFIGYNTGNGSSDVESSNFIGDGAGTGSFITGVNFIGSVAGNGANNVSNSNFIGTRAGSEASGASYCNLIGYQVGLKTPTNNIGENNIIIGTEISLPNATNNAINLGGVLFGTGCHSSEGLDPSITAISGGKIGIGVVNPSETLEVGGNIKANGTIQPKAYTVATLPTPTGTAYATVTDALAPAYLVTVVGGGAIVCPVFYNGTNWVSH